jgi:serine/threonine protein kinase
MESGQMLAHYRVEEQIGKGGMGEVFRAHDTKLSRDVALKILPPEFSSDKDRLGRFEREAKVLASLNHPNIAAIFGFETTPECTFLVMELVEGEDLAEVLRKGALPVDEAVDVARQIAEGLEEAHENGIVHRDLKPANVKRTPEGKVKVLDFGLARAFAGQTAGEDQMASDMTMTAPMTQLGTVLGTAAYMSPEQARGKDVDRRADIWAFGVILFEMLTGKRLFDGETASDTLAGILKSEPEWDQLPDDLPFQVNRVLRRCLAKDPRQRLRDIGEARVRLEDPEAESGMFSGPISAIQDSSGQSRWSRIVPWALLAASLAAVSWLALGGRSSQLTETQHLAVPAPLNADFHITGSFPGLPEISPDGKMLAFSAQDKETKAIQLFVRSLDQPQPIALSDTKDAQYPFWSPDGEWVGYNVRGKGLMKVPTNGGPPQMICPSNNGKGGSWNETGDILFTVDYNSPITTAKATGGEPRAVTDLENDEGFNSHRHPQFLPGGRQFLYFARGAGKVESQIRLASLDGGPEKVVTTNALMGFYSSGYLAFIVHGDLVAQPFDPATGVLSGSPTPLVVDVLTVPGAAKGAFSMSREGSLTYLQGETTEEATLTWRDRSGKETEQVGDLAAYDIVSLSPDGRSAAVLIITDQAGTWDIWIIDLERNFRTRFTTDPSDDYDMVWGKDSRHLYFVSDRGGKEAVYMKEVGSPEPPQKIFETEEDLRLWDVAADGRQIIYTTSGDGTVWDLWTADLSGETEPRLLRGSPEQDVVGQLSPDEKWLLFASFESGTSQVYVTPWPAISPITQVSTTTGIWSAWTKEGREVVFQELDGNLVSSAVTVEQGRMLIGQPEPLFTFAAPVLEGSSWDVSTSGEQFLTVNNNDAMLPRYCNLVLNWPKMIEER